MTEVHGTPDPGVVGDEYATDAEVEEAIAAIPAAEATEVVGYGDRFTTGKWYGPMGASSFATVSNTGNSIGRLFAAGIIVAREQAFDRLGFWQGSDVASSVARMGIYEDDGDGQPGALVVDAGTVTTASGAGTWKTVTISQTLSPGRYWLALVSQGGASVPSMARVIMTNIPTFIGIDEPASDSFGSTVCYYRDSVSGALPDPFGSTLRQLSSVTGVYVPLIRAA